MPIEENRYFAESKIIQILLTLLYENFDRQNVLRIWYALKFLSQKQIKGKPEKRARLLIW